ncbi:hypothetical protein AJ80_04027 [Polytolypa hystricis UAMH7299]|uniref:FAD-binding FR-type domain-containing protein n=1 Tax=Polytolypa hystricis (strain UAMH7299) TaxID=1447883 RepID=A0A2B7Y541_POLH7|nr:hypothetical protein AJ80_04027 [Polytolypa hystricis UAMH7299]
MNVPEVYSIAVAGSIITLLVIRAIMFVLVACRLVACLLLSLSTKSSRFLFIYFPKLYHRVSRVVSRYFLLQILYFCGTAACNFIGVGSTAQAGSRAAQLAVVNLVPVLLASSHDFGARMLGISLRTYGSIHTTSSLMVFIQSLIHTATVIHRATFSPAEPQQFYGSLGGLTLLLLCVSLIIQRRYYEIFLKAHLACTIFLIYSLWRHVQLRGRFVRLCVATSAALFMATFTLRVARALFRNLAFGKFFCRLTLNSQQGSNPGDAFEVKITLPRPWKVKAGEWIKLSVPHVGLFYLFQTHRFVVVWSEDGSGSNASSISLLIKPRSGFTRRILDRIQPQTECRAWIDGPYGPSRIGRFGTRTVGDYGHVVMFATDIGIAVQIPYIRETLTGIKECRVRTRSITLVWQMDRSNALDEVRQWLQDLVAEDKSYNLQLLVYDASRASSLKDPLRFGEHDLIQVYGGEVNWQEQLENEISNRKGRLLVMVSAQRHVREKIRDFVQENVYRDVELLDLEFQPWASRKRWCPI